MIVLDCQSCGKTTRLPDDRSEESFCVHCGSNWLIESNPGDGPMCSICRRRHGSEIIHECE